MRSSIIASRFKGNGCLDSSISSPTFREVLGLQSSGPIFKEVCINIDYVKI